MTILAIITKHGETRVTQSDQPRIRPAYDVTVTGELWPRYSPLDLAHTNFPRPGARPGR